jgi:signal transduction histidine kinase/CheY-like chemotaxis protein
MAAESTLLVGAYAWIEGGLGAPGLLWSPIVPVAAVLVAGRRAGLVWTVATVAVLAVLLVLECEGIHASFPLEGTALALLRFGLAAGAVVFFFVLSAVFESLKADAFASLEAANHALAEARDQAEAATRAKSTFLAMMSHEIRTPLHGIFGMTELALDAGEESERREFIRRARACAETLLSVINDVLDFSRIEADRLTLEHAEFDLREVVDGVLDTLATEAVGKGLDLVGCVDDRLPAVVLGDAGRLRQILINLAGNALKFTDRGSVVIRLEGEGAAEEGALALRGEVRDTGIGIAREKQTAIFEAFAQADSSDTRRHRGTGLGLAITRRLVALMGGTIALESAPGRGSVFRFTARLGVTDGRPPERSQVPPGRSLLLVTGAAASRRHLAHTLRAFGWQVTVARDGAGVRAALAATPAARFDVVLLDLTLAEAERREALARVRALETDRPATLVGLAPLGVTSGGRDQGTAAVVSAPVTRRGLLQVLSRLEAGPEPPPTPAPRPTSARAGR